MPQRTIRAQPPDADLTAIAALATTGTIERTGAGTVNTYTVSSQVRTALAGSSPLATLDPVSGRLPFSQLSTEVLGAAVFKGVWNPSTNTPTLVNGGGGLRAGDYYVCSADGVRALDGVGGADDPWTSSDVAIFDGTVWRRIDARDAVRSVNGQIGAVSLTAANVGAQATFTSQTANQVFAAPDSTAGVPGFRALVAADIPLATSTLKGAVSRETSGTFTPVLEGGATAGAQTYNARIGTYYLVGKICIATIYIELATKGAGMDGNATISGLPFTTAAGIQSAAVSQYAGVTFTAGYTQLSARIEASNTRLLLFQGGSGVGSLVLQASAIGSGFVITITAAYITA